MTEYVVDFGDSTSSAFVGLAMAEAASHGAEMREKIVRCRDCECFATNIHGSYCKKSITWLSEPEGFCAWASKREGAES